MSDIEREAQLRERNAAGKVRHRVITVLDLECEQIRAYLDRPTPNVGAALASVEHLEGLLAILRIEAQS